MQEKKKKNSTENEKCKYKVALDKNIGPTLYVCYLGFVYIIYVVLEKKSNKFGIKLSHVQE